MIKKIQTIFFAVVTCLTMASCSKPNPGNLTPAASPNMTTYIDGKAWSAKAGGVIQFGMMNVTGIQSSDGQTITISLTGTTTGTYMLGPGLNNAAAYKPDSGSNTVAFSTGVDSTTGQVVITSIDSKNKTMSGTFYFTVERATDNKKHTMTSGKFTNIPYTGSLPVTSSTCSATVNGASWTTNSVFISDASGTYIISATKNDGTTIGFSMPDNITTGTYNFAPFGTYTAQYNANTSTFYQAQSGSITIQTKTSTTMTGTFSFNGTNLANTSDMVTVTNGSFSVQL